MTNIRCALIAVCTVLCGFSTRPVSAIEHGGQSISRKDLLTAILGDQTVVDRVEIKQITLAAQQAAGLHRHPCPVVGYIVSGNIEFQIEGEPSHLLREGDVFLEPANAHIAHFDNVTQKPAIFVAFYLLAKDEHEIIQMLNASTKSASM